MGEFRIGDRVRVVKGTPRAGSIDLSDNEGVVRRVDGNAYLVTGEGWDWGGWFEASQLEHVEDVSQ